VRPSLHVGAVSWIGKSYTPDESVADLFFKLDPPKGVFLHVSPGVELSAGRFVDFDLRLVPELPIGGRFEEVYQDGLEVMDPRPSPTGERGIGLSAMLGVQLRIPVLRPKYPDARSTIRFEDDDI